MCTCMQHGANATNSLLHLAGDVLAIFNIFYSIEYKSMIGDILFEDTI